MKDIELRYATIEDNYDILMIYEYYVLNTAITFECNVPTIAEMNDRMKNIQKKYPFLVALVDNNIVGYTYASDFRYKEAYQWSAESTIYLNKDSTGKGIGKILYQKLIDILKIQGYYNLFGGIALPNDPSIELHLKLGFTKIGTYKNIGYKHGHWHSTQWYQLVLNPYQNEPKPPQMIPRNVLI